MKQVDVILINMSSYSEWSRGVSNRNYHVLKQLISSDRIGRILAVDYLPLTRKRAIRNLKENILRTIDGGEVVARSLTDKLTKISDSLHVYSNIDFFLRPQHAAEMIQKTAMKLHFGDYIVWSFFPPIMPYIRNMGQKLTIFDAVDNWAEHSSYAHIKRKLEQDYALIKSNADIIFTVAEDLQKLFDNQPNVFWVPNGVDVSHYREKRILLNRDIADIPRPIIGYIGVVQERVDIDLIKELARKNPSKSFVIVGPIWREINTRKLREIKNLYILGYKSYDEAPAYIQQFDVAILPHKKSSFITSTNPMKLYEYLASGKPVVATKGSGAEQFKNVVYIADNKTDFNRKLFVALEENSPEKVEERKNAVKQYSWTTVVKQMLDIVEKKLNY